MKFLKGLILGKFLPLHAGHIALIEFGVLQCNELYVVLCAEETESVTGSIRLGWLNETFSGKPGVKPVVLTYNKSDLPDTSVSSREASSKWAQKIRAEIGSVEVIFSSEPYGDYMADELSCAHICFDKERIKYPVSATLIRNHPFRYWEFLADAAKPFYVKKICLYGTESTGKSTLTIRLAEFFRTSYVPEIARDIIQKTDQCTEMDLQSVARAHALAITAGLKCARMILFVDTDIHITKSYAQFLFQRELIVDEWIEKTNQFELYLYLNKDDPYFQDGTRLDENRRDALDEYHAVQLKKVRVPVLEIKGDWEERFQRAIEGVTNFLENCNLEKTTNQQV